tara:strand:- start:2126 stop:2746 length:621 start_codon:yes stop_codon:yes gene_type:complete
MGAFGKKRYQAMAKIAPTEGVTMTSPTISSPIITSAAISEAAGLQVSATAKVTNISNASGDTLANDTAASNFVNGDHGKIVLCNLASASKTVTLPVSSEAKRIGQQITIIQNADLVASGVLIISAGTSNTFSVNSFAMAKTAVYQAAQRPADANNTITITGANSNSSWAVGSKAVFTCVAANEWHFAIMAEAIGTGKADAIAFSTV